MFGEGHASFIVTQRVVPLLPTETWPGVLGPRQPWLGSRTIVRHTVTGLEPVPVLLDCSSPEESPWAVRQGTPDSRVRPRFGVPAASPRRKDRTAFGDDTQAEVHGDRSSHKRRGGYDKRCRNRRMRDTQSSLADVEVVKTNASCFTSGRPGVRPGERPVSPGRVVRTRHVR